MAMKKTTKSTKKPQCNTKKLQKIVDDLTYEYGEKVLKTTAEAKICPMCTLEAIIGATGALVASLTRDLIAYTKESTVESMKAVAEAAAVGGNAKEQKPATKKPAAKKASK